MKKKLFLAIPAALTAFALVMTACPTGSSPGKTSGGENDDETYRLLTSLSLQGGEQNVTASGKARSETLSEIEPRDINLSTAAAVNKVEVTLNYTGNFKGKATIAKEAAGVELSDASFTTVYNPSAKPSFNFADGDLLYVKMTAKNGKDYYYYGYKVLIGWDASLNSIKLVDKDTGLPVGNVDIDLKEPKKSIAEIGVNDESIIQFNAKGEKFGVTGVPNDSAAAVKISTNGTDWTTLANGDEITFADGDYLYFYVKSPNGKAEAYYKVKIILLRSVAIPYGTPPKIDAEDRDDDWWNDPANATGWLDINRTNINETQAILDMDPKDRSFGRAKLAWDVEGIYLYAQVWEQNITEVTEAGGSNHTVSSVELFICESNERTGTVAASTNENGGQYRLGANGEKTGPQTNQTDAFNALGQSNAVKYTGGAAGNMPTSPQSEPGGIGTTVTTGYVLVYQAPWLFYDKYSLGDGKMVGIEIQINATGDNGNRVGVLNWNSASTNSYTSLAAFGEGTLKLGEGVTMGARRPQITTQPADQTILIKTSGTDAIKQLTVAATSPESGTIGADWYQTTLPDDFDIAGKTSVGTGLSYTPTVSNATEGVYYYFARVSNTVTGKATKYANSRMVLLAVVDPTQPIVVDLSRQAMTGWDGSGVGNRVQGTYDETAKSITWEFGKDEDETKNGDQRVAIALTPGQAASIQAAKALEVTIKGTAAPGSAAKYRCYIGTISTQNSWNGTDAFPGSASKFEAVGKADGIAHQVKMSGNIGSAGRGSYFILRSSAAGEDKVTITEITIVPKDTAWPTTP